MSDPTDSNAADRDGHGGTGVRGRRRGALAVLAAFAVAVALRASPLIRSSLPFNPDGIVYAGHVRLVAATGRLPLSRMPVDDLQFTAFLSVVSAVTGESALVVAQPAIAVVGAVPVLVAAAVARRIAARITRTAVPVGRVGPGVAAGLLAVGGLTLHRAMAVDEQTLGLLLVPLATVAYARASHTGRLGWYAVTAALALALPPTHNLDTVVFGLVLVGWAVLAPGRTPRRLAGHVAAAVAFWAYAVGYFSLTARLTPAYVIQSARLTEALDLFAAWVILGAFGLAALARARPRRVRVAGALAVCVAFGLLALNAATAVFPGLPRTPGVLLAALLPLAIPSLAAAWALPTALADRPDGRAMAALATAVALAIGFSLSAALTPPYLNTIYRVQTFAHLPWAVLAGVALAVGLPRVRGVTGRSDAAGSDAAGDGSTGSGGSVDPRHSGRPGRLRRAAVPVAAAVLLTCAAASLPIAFAGVDVVPYRGITEEAEFAGTSHAVAHVPGTWAGDDHLVRIAGYYDRDEPARRAPVSGWLAGGPPPDCAVVSQASWATVGAQQYPRPAVAVDPGRYRGLLADRHVVYDAGTRDRVAMSLPSRPGGADC
ncbi:hypothetical protein Hbl1158_14635 [Halobaculum sp. CBA1158]|uniref:hypothetical protein n=1 Tax=Halobaculum sp. CBA1158 TaxID=2904243 RepID=UPI001F45ABF3|nr:hypothetical protein [Halobaculum sp. CBA1158]UIO99738.1 hypothetical protein Hbl1158_14635 [Halobaculum sp. CBA1158]